MRAPFNQCDPAWASHLLGSGGHPGTICQFGCLVCDNASIANDSGHPTNPAAFNDLCVSKGIYMAEADGTKDLLPTNALDKVYPGDYTTVRYAGFRADLIKVAVPSKDTYVRLYINGYAPGWKMNVSHFVFAWTADGTYVGDPQGGVIRPLSFYGGSANVKNTDLVTRNYPAPPAPPPPAPMPVYAIKVGNAIFASGLSYNDAVKQADTWAAAHVGLACEVVDSKGEVVYVGFVAPLPAPVPPPVPPPQPTPIPAPPPDFWGILQQLIIQVILFFKRGVQP